MFPSLKRDRCRWISSGFPFDHPSDLRNCLTFTSLTSQEGSRLRGRESPFVQYQGTDRELGALGGLLEADAEQDQNATSAFCTHVS